MIEMLRAIGGCPPGDQQGGRTSAKRLPIRRKEKPAGEVTALGLEPKTYGLKVRGSKAGTRFGTINLRIHRDSVCTNACTTPQNPSKKRPSKDPELARLVAAWPALPKHIKAAVLALVDSHSPR